MDSILDVEFCKQAQKDLLRLEGPALAAIEAMLTVTLPEKGFMESRQHRDLCKINGLDHVYYVRIMGTHACRLFCFLEDVPTEGGRVVHVTHHKPKSALTGDRDYVREGRRTERSRASWRKKGSC